MTWRPTTHSSPEELLQRLQSPALGDRSKTGLESGPPGMGSAAGPIHLSGGELLQQAKHPAFVTAEELYRALPEDGWFDPNVAPSRPIMFELGAYTVPVNTQLWIFDYQFQVYRLSGLDPGDSLPAEEGRFATVLGWDITAANRRASHLLYQLDPVPVSTTRQSFEAQPGTTVGRTSVQAAFNRSAFTSFAAQASGSSLLPVRSDVQGPRERPFMMIARATERVALSCYIFRPIPIPVTHIEGRWAGYLIHTNTAEALLERVRPR